MTVEETRRRFVDKQNRVSSGRSSRSNPNIEFVPKRCKRKANCSKNDFYLEKETKKNPIRPVVDSNSVWRNEHLKRKRQKKIFSKKKFFFTSTNNDFATTKVFRSADLFAVGFLFRRSLAALWCSPFVQETAILPTDWRKTKFLFPIFFHKFFSLKHFASLHQFDQIDVQKVSIFLTKLFWMINDRRRVMFYRKRRNIDLQSRIR